ncbi:MULTISPECIES: lysophospholipid acyltransferase family protein [unclassified Acinetobacter]|uniref:lysophospholipid acyltransferase family protein n=1 Tax=unclassified Acinetobacter TaxID=196816 RepID=UPI0029348F6B|nr:MULTISPECIES: lysophospholipid acyltransferase family protein [unclassified Acinetobacter]WOE33182.1 lysophospholipid acyltransferase family protein [Acinetobacter sp. SAAs470]WOE39843.1 lysophospholipid acyltransferase family protein [Acinetobacter sp. SAAs474]
MSATGFCFASFGVGGLILGGLVAPIIKQSTKNEKLRQDRTQKLVKYTFKGFTEMLVKLGVMHYEIEGLEKLEHSQQELVIANHPTLIDVVILIGAMGRANCVVKQALWSNPFVKDVVQNAGYILNAGSEQFIQDCVAKLTQDKAASLLIFPEGTRTEKGNILNEFQRGAANIALRANVPIRPVCIRCTPSTLTKNEKWYHIPSHRFYIHVKIMDTIAADQLLEDNLILTEHGVHPKTVRHLNQILHQHFMKELLTNEQSC